MARKSGILMPMSALPSPYGIGTMGKSAYQFIDFLKAAGQKYWQLLPLGPTSYGDSPYSSFSSFAGNPYFIDLDLLVKEKLLRRSEIEGRDWGSDPEKVDYARIYENRFEVLRLAFLRGREPLAEELAAFLSRYNKPVSVCESIRDGVSRAQDRADENSVVCAVGSLYSVGEIRACFERY